MDAHMCPCGTTLESRAHIVGEGDIYKEVWDVSKKIRKLDECDMEEFGRLESTETTIAILGDRWPQTSKQEGDRISKHILCKIWKKISTQTLEVSLSGVGTVVRLERNAWSKVKGQRQATNEYALPPPSSLKYIYV